KGAKQHVRDHQTKHVIAEELEPLIAAAAVAHPGHCGNMRERLLQQRRVAETIADAGLDRRRAPPLLRLAWRQRMIARARGAIRGAAAWRQRTIVRARDAVRRAAAGARL